MSPKGAGEWVFWEEKNNWLLFIVLVSPRGEVVLTPPSHLIIPLKRKGGGGIYAFSLIVKLTFPPPHQKNEEKKLVLVGNMSRGKCY